MWSLPRLHFLHLALLLVGCVFSFLAVCGTMFVRSELNRRKTLKQLRDSKGARTATVIQISKGA